MIDSNELEIREIKYNTEEYSRELELRDAVLRIPLGMSIYHDNLEADKNDLHLGAFVNYRLVGVLILTTLSTEDVKMRQVAVDEQWRTKKVGSEMVRYVETLAKNKGYRQMVLNARKSAVGFYKKLGYEIISEEFLEINLPHYKMRKRLE
jgi:predicted GNAT family N-acyltransferase